jgi:hypothetical protein
MQNGSRLTMFLAAFAMVIVPVAMYAGAYLWLTTTSESSLSGPACFTRRYRSDSEAKVFVPAAKVEAWWLGEIVLLEGQARIFDSDGYSFPVPDSQRP